MRFKDKPSNQRWLEKEDVGKERIVTKFLLFPRHFGDETRWLEYAKIKERVLPYSNELESGYAYEEVDWGD